MKLLQKTIRSYLLYSGFILLLAIPASYLAVRGIVKEDADEHLEATRTAVQPRITQAILNDTLATLSFADQDITLSPSRDPKPYEHFTNQDVYDTVSRETVPCRILQTNFIVRGRPYLLQVRNSMLDRDDLIESIVEVQVLLLLLLLSGLLLINRRLSQRIWKPFYLTLERLRAYTVEQDPPLRLDPSSISEFDDLNRSLRELTDRTRKTYLAQREFTENASHEIQTPLAIFQSKLELLLQTDPLNQEQAGLISDLADASQRLVRLNKSLILLTRIENQQFPDTDRLSLTSVLEKAFAHLDPQIRARQIVLEKDLREDPVLEANRTLLEVLVSNLLQNAIRHNIPGGLIRVTAGKHELLVQNTGKSTPLDPQQVFLRFFKDSTDPNSIGLGLQIVLQISALYGWTAAYTYRDGLHTFSITLREY